MTDNVLPAHQELLEKDMHLQRLTAKWNDRQDSSGEVGLSSEARPAYLAILEEQRKWLLDRNRTDSTIDEEVVRKFLHQIDLEEEKIRSHA